MATTEKVRNKEQQSLNEIKKRKNHLKENKKNFTLPHMILPKLEYSNDDDDEEIRLKSTRSATMSNSIELQRLSASVETMRTSILQAYTFL